MTPALFFVMDCESVGLHGETFAVGYVVVDGTGKELDSGRFGCHPDAAAGDDAGRQWVAENCPSFSWYHETPADMRGVFWDYWLSWKAKGAVLAADCAWPVEARFLAACVDDDPGVRCWQGPYPLHDVASTRLAAGLDPLATVGRLPQERPVHDPLADARQSARLLIEALDRIASLGRAAALSDGGP